VGEDERRVGINESAFREVNERIEELGERFETAEVEFVCECANSGCTERLNLTTGEYEHVRSEPDRFLLVPGHERPGTERVVEDHGRYLVVEKLGEAGEIAEASDPRSG